MVTINSNQIPKEVRDAIYSVDVEDKVVTIGKKFLLHLDQIADLHDSINMVFMGELKPSEFSKDIEQMLEIPKKQADQITKEVNDQIFVEILDKIHRYDNKLEDDSEEGGDESENELSRIDDPYREKTELMGAIINPTTVPSPSKTILRKPQIGQQAESQTQIESNAIPLAPAPATNDGMPTPPSPTEETPVATKDPHEEKLEEVTVSEARVTKTNPAVKSALIPNEHKEKINQDPYKESLE